MNERMITGGLGIIAALAVELLPGIKGWWAALSPNVKVAVRGWSGLLFALLAVVIAQGPAVLQTPEMLTDIGTAWVTFLIGAEGTYQLTAVKLPRKQLY